MDGYRIADEHEASEYKDKCRLPDPKKGDIYCKKGKYTEELEIKSKVSLNKETQKEWYHEAVEYIKKNHKKIIDDWCKAYPAQIYQEDGEIKPGCFTLVEQELHEENGKLVKNYFFRKRRLTEKEHEDLVSEIGDQYFSICCDDLQNDDYPACVDIIDAEDETLITVCAGKDSRKEAQALVKLLNGE